MDVRDFEFWLGEADRDEISRRIAMMCSTRFAMWADAKQFQRSISDLQRRVSVFDGVYKQQVEENWSGLKSMRRG
jgi:hypothetical protein